MRGPSSAGPRDPSQALREINGGTHLTAGRRLTVCRQIADHMVAPNESVPRFTCCGADGKR